MRHRVQIAEPLRYLQTAFKQRVVDAKDLHHAPCPANSVTCMVRKARCGQSCRLREVEIRRAPSGSVHTQRSMGIFRDSLYRDPVDLLQSCAPEYCARPAEECGVPQIIAVLNDPV